MQKISPLFQAQEILLNFQRKAIITNEQVSVKLFYDILEIHLKGCLEINAMGIPRNKKKILNRIRVQQSFQ